MSFEALIPYLAGPGGAIVICCLVGWGVYRLMVFYFVPLLQAAIDRHLAQVDAMDARHSKEHDRIMARCDAGFDRVDSGLVDIQKKVDAMVSK